MQKLLLLLSLVSWLALPAAIAQQFSGVVSDARTGQGLPFVNVGVVGKSLGTVSSEQGAYRLAFSEALANDTVRISSLGYQPRRLTLRELQAHPNQALTPAAVSLSEVRVQASNPLQREHTLGFTKADGNTTFSFNSKDYGAEIGTRIQLRRRPTRVQSVTFNVAHNQVGAITFRLNLYRLTPSGQPTNTKLLTRDVLVDVDLVQGPITVDLSADKLVLSEDFLLALEWVKGSNATRLHNDFAFTGGVGYADNDVYTRSTSQDTWERIHMGAVLAGMQFKLAFFATVRD